VYLCVVCVFVCCMCICVLYVYLCVVCVFVCVVKAKKQPKKIKKSVFKMFFFIRCFKFKRMFTHRVILLLHLFFLSKKQKKKTLLMRDQFHQVLIQIKDQTLNNGQKYSVQKQLFHNTFNMVERRYM
jgi:hypothetical protein